MERVSRYWEYVVITRHHPWNPVRYKFPTGLQMTKIGPFTPSGRVLLCQWKDESTRRIFRYYRCFVVIGLGVPTKTTKMTYLTTKKSERDEGHIQGGRGYSSLYSLRIFLLTSWPKPVPVVNKTDTQYDLCSSHLWRSIVLEVNMTRKVSVNSDVTLNQRTNRKGFEILVLLVVTLNPF